MICLHQTQSDHRQPRAQLELVAMRSRGRAPGPVAWRASHASGAEHMWPGADASTPPRPPRGGAARASRAAALLASVVA